MTNDYLKKVKNGDIIHFKGIFGLEGVGIFYNFDNVKVCFYCITYKDLRDTVYFMSNHTFQKCVLNIDAITHFEFASEDEIKELYNKIGKYFTENYDNDWYNHFTDSSYFDVQDFLFNVFCIKTEEYDNDLNYPDFINDIHQHIWNRLCEVTNEDVEHKENKMVNIDDVCKWIKENWRNHIHKDADGMIGFIGWESELRNSLK